jgi:hypothetical protein
MKNTALFILTFLFSFSIKAQTSHQAFTAAGGDVSHSSGSIAFSIGQVFYTSSSSSTGSSISQGVQQARKSITTLFLDLKVLVDGYYINESNPPLMVPARYTNLVEAGSSNPGLPTESLTGTYIVKKGQVTLTFPIQHGLVRGKNINAYYTGNVFSPIDNTSHNAIITSIPNVRSIRYKYPGF